MGKKILIGVGIVILILVLLSLAWIFRPQYGNDVLEIPEDDPSQEALREFDPSTMTQEELAEYEAEKERRLTQTEKEVLISSSRRIIFDPPKCGERLCESEQSSPIETATISLYDSAGDLIGTQNRTLARFENVPLGEYSYVVVSPEFGEVTGDFIVERSIEDSVYVQADFVTTE